MEICDSANILDLPYLRWETVRLFRSPGIIGKSPFESGFEGYFIGKYEHPDEILVAESQLAKSVLDQGFRSFTYDHNRRKAIDTLINGSNSIRPENLPTLYNMFHALIDQVKMQVATSPDEAFKQAFQTFPLETIEYVYGAPKSKYVFTKDRELFQTIFLPKDAQAPSIPITAETDALVEIRDGFEMIRVIGLMGHPISRKIESIPVLISKISGDRAYYPPKGTPKRIRLDEFERELLLKHLRPRNKSNAIEK